jgi:hypothetical protein
MRSQVIRRNALWVWICFEMARYKAAELAMMMTIFSLLSRKSVQTKSIERTVRSKRVRRFANAMIREESARAAVNRRRRLTVMTCLILIYSTTRVVDIDTEKLPQYTTWFEECVMIRYTDRQWFTRTICLHVHGRLVVNALLCRVNRYASCGLVDFRWTGKSR